MPNRRSPRSPLRLKNSAVCGRTRPLHLASAPRARLGTAPPCTALPSTRLEGCSRLTLPSPPLYRTTRARHGARGLPRLFPGPRRARLSACQLLFGRPAELTPHATPTRVRISPGRHRIRADKSRRPNRYRTLPPHLIAMSGQPQLSFNNQMNRDWTPPGPGWVYREKEGDFQRLRVARLS